MDVSGIFEELNELEESHPCIDEVAGLEDREILEVVMCECLAEVYYQLLYTISTIKCQYIRLLLLGDSLTIHTFAHNIIEVLNRNRTKVQYLNDFEFQIYTMCCSPCLDHGVHDLAGVLVEEDAD